MYRNSRNYQDNNYSPRYSPRYNNNYSPRSSPRSGPSPRYYEDRCRKNNQIVKDCQKKKQKNVSIY